MRILYGRLLVDENKQQQSEIQGSFAALRMTA